MLEDKRGEFTSIYGTSLKKREFKTAYDRNKFIEDSKITRIFENLPPYQQFLIDNMWEESAEEDFTKNPLKICFLDIECPAKGEFPNIEDPNNVINLITCYDSISKKYTTFGLKAFEHNRDDLDYWHCKSEEDLLKRFIKHFRSDYPDLLVGWNSNGFDIPYLINRITFEIGKEWADKLSPIGRIYEKINQKGKFGQATKEYVIEGISCLDYMILYGKFKLDDKPENNKLDTVGDHELRIGKNSYDGDLWDLARDDWYAYVEYNIQDVKLIIDLDNKLAYIDLIRFIATQGLTTMDKAVATIGVVNGAIAIKARSRGEYISAFKRQNRIGKNAGGFVQESKQGFSENVVSFDANSLYPSVMISLNISPETKLGKYEIIDDMVNFTEVSGRLFKLTKENFDKYVKEKNASISESGHLFHQKSKGLMPEFLDNLYSKRKDMKAKGKKLQKYLYDNKSRLDDSTISKIEYRIQRFDTYQMAYKILLNSMYGYTGNPYAMMGDDDIANSVTLTGQNINKENRSLFVRYLMEEYGVDEEDAENSCIAGDTDSGYFSFKCLEDVAPLLIDGEINPKFIKLCENVADYINDNISKLVKYQFKSADPRIVYSREAIADIGIFLAKKHYVLHMVDDEGIRVDKFKYKGVEVVKGTMPKQIKPHIKGVTEHMMNTQSRNETNEKFNEAYEVFKNLEIIEISENTGIKEYEKYADKCDGMNTVKGMPHHAKAAYFYNMLLDKMEISGKYQKIKSGDKVRAVKVKFPNKYNIEKIGFLGKWPDEFDSVFEVDYEFMFNKLFYAAINRFYDAVGWNLRKPSENLRVELDDIFGE